MFKIFISAILIFNSIFAFLQTTVNVDWESKSKPEVTYKRGTAEPAKGGFFDDVQTREYIDYQRFIGMTIFNGIRNLFKDPETNEFYFENGENIKQQIPKFTNIRIRCWQIILTTVISKYVSESVPTRCCFAFRTIRIV